MILLAVINLLADFYEVYKLRPASHFFHY